MRVFLAVILIIAACSASFAQFPQLNTEDMLTYSHEDLSDFLRRFPGMYALDYGTLGAPSMLKPWRYSVWDYAVYRDDIPAYRIGDGVFEPTLIPPAELQSIRYDFLSSPKAGRFDLTTRTLPVDSPYTELQTREGYYGLGLVDFAHAQRLYHSFTIEASGRLGWFDGRRTTALVTNESNLYRLRGRAGINVGSHWRAWLSYEGANVDSRTDIQANITGAPDSYYIEREQGSLRIAEQDSSRSHWAPELTIFARQDRENWGDNYRGREAVRGWSFNTTIPSGFISPVLTQRTFFARIDVPGYGPLDEFQCAADLADTMESGVGEFSWSGGVRRESAMNPRDDDSWAPLLAAHAAYQSRRVEGFALFGGISYSETLPPPIWVYGSYRISDRPLAISPEFVNGATDFIGSRGNGYARNPDRDLKLKAGVSALFGSLQIEPYLLLIDPQGTFRNRFTVIDDTSVALVYDKTSDTDPEYIAAIHANLPLYWGFSAEGDWYSQFQNQRPAELSSDLENRLYSRLNYSQKFFKAPLIVRGALTFDYIGLREGYSDRGINVLEDYASLGFRISGTIGGVTLIWGADNLLSNYYNFRHELMPGYSMNHKEEYLGVIWKLWL